jgi:hypothetical protein
VASAEATGAGPGRRTAALVAALVVWSLLVWGGRVRNALADPVLDPAQRRVPLLLASLFILLALVVGVLALGARRRPAAARGLRVALAATAAWTTGFWVVRALDIALDGGHDAAFVVVHVVLAVVSIALAVGAWRSEELDRGRRGVAPVASR